MARTGLEKDAINADCLEFYGNEFRIILFQFVNVLASNQKNV